MKKKWHPAKKPFKQWVRKKRPLPPEVGRLLSLQRPECREMDSRFRALVS